MSFIRSLRVTLPGSVSTDRTKSVIEQCVLFYSKLRSFYLTIYFFVHSISAFILLVLVYPFDRDREKMGRERTFSHESNVFRYANILPSLTIWNSRECQRVVLSDIQFQF